MRYDLTRPLRPGMPVYPGDPPVTADGGRWSLGTHTGTHLDAPAHLLAGGEDVAALPLERLSGEAFLIEAAGCLEADALRGVPAEVCRLLVRGGAFLSPEAAERLVCRRVLLFGTDAASCDAPEAVGLPAHRRLLAAGTPILEGLQLAGVPLGWGRLYCLPLRLAADGCPVRAVWEVPT